MTEFRPNAICVCWQIQGEIRSSNRLPCDRHEVSQPIHCCDQVSLKRRKDFSYKKRIMIKLGVKKFTSFRFRRLIPSISSCGFLVCWCLCPARCHCMMRWCCVPDTNTLSGSGARRFTAFMSGSLVPSMISRGFLKREMKKQIGYYFYNFRRYF